MRTVLGSDTSSLGSLNKIGAATRSTACKQMALQVIPSRLLASLVGGGKPVEDDEEPESLLASLVGGVALALRARTQLLEQPPVSLSSRALDDTPSLEAADALDSQERERLTESLRLRDELREWDRILVSYLQLLCYWVYGEKAAVREVLAEGGFLGVVSTSPYINHRSLGSQSY